jgi:hypothetical protein
MSKEEMAAIRDLNGNENIIILQADKGNATVVMDLCDYKEKMKLLLEDPAYKLSANDPTVYLEKKTKALITKTSLSPELMKQLIPPEKSSRVPKFYGSPKIHKEGIPLRPIVDAAGSCTHKTARYAAKLIQPIPEKAKSYVKNSTHFIELIHEITIEPEDILVSFDVVSLYTKVPVQEALDILAEKKVISEDILKLVKHCMFSTYFIYEGQFYKQKSGAPMGSPLSPVIANIFMEKFETDALLSAPLTPRCWYRYVDDVFVVWQHGRDALNVFLNHLNSLHVNIKFTIEIEVLKKLPFLDVLVERKNNNTLGHTVYRKPTHTNRYLNAKSHHHPAQIASIPITLSIRSKRIADAENLNNEYKILENALLKNGFDRSDILKAWNRNPGDKKAASKDKERALGTAFLPYVKGTTDRIRKILSKENINTIFDTDKKIGTLFKTGKDKVHLEEKGVYEIPCQDCNKSYIGQTGRRISNRRKEHELAVKQFSKSSALAQHSVSNLHKIDFKNTKTLASINFLKPRLVREAIEIEKRPVNLNTRDDGTCLPVAWKPIIYSKRINQDNHQNQHKQTTYENLNNNEHKKHTEIKENAVSRDTSRVLRSSTRKKTPTVTLILN